MSTHNVIGLIADKKKFNSHFFRIEFFSIRIFRLEKNSSRILAHKEITVI